jgi:hypothetical protein
MISMRHYSISHTCTIREHTTLQYIFPFQNFQQRKLYGIFLEVIWNIFRLKGDEVIGEWRKLYNEELCDLNSSPSIIRMVKSRRMRWVGHVAPMGEKRKAYGSGKARGKETTRKTKMEVG